MSHAAAAWIDVVSLDAIKFEQKTAYMLQTAASEKSNMPHLVVLTALEKEGEERGEW